MRIVMPPVSPAQGTRGIDAYGGGGFGAPRRRGDKSYEHKGLDFLGQPGDRLIAPVCGPIIHLGIAYPDSTLGSIHIGGASGSVWADFLIKLFYGRIENQFEKGAMVYSGMPIGFVQNIAKHHDAEDEMLNHIHMELYVKGELVDPARYLVEVPCRRL